MSRPPKPTSVIKSEKKSHRTKSELEHREAAESGLLSGKILTERKHVADSSEAHAEFVRVSELMRSIDKDDDLYSAVLNRYCILYSECLEFEILRNKLSDIIDVVNKGLDFLDKELEFDELLKLTKAVDNLARKIITIDASVMSKRKMMFDIEKENVMTVSSALRSIPKTPEKQENALIKALSDDG